MSDAKIYAAAAVAGGVAGLRSLAAPAIVSRFGRAQNAGLLNYSLAAKIIPVLAVGEAIADKLPFMPNRTLAPSVAFRAISGGISGAAIATAKRKPAFWGVVLGAAAAVGATYGAYHLRRKISKGLHVPDAIVALAEDTLAVSAGFAALRCLTESAAELT